MAGTKLTATTTTNKKKSGWFSANKTQAQKARDRARAQAQRRRPRGRGRSQRKAASEDDDDFIDDDDIDSFIVNDDEDVEEEGDWSSGDEEESDEDEASEALDEESSLDTSKRGASAARAPKKRRTLLFNSDNDSDDDDDILFNSKPSKRKSKPAPALAKILRHGAAAPRRKPRRDDPDDDEDILTSPEGNRPVAAASRKRLSPGSSSTNEDSLAKKRPSLTSPVSLSSSGIDEDDEDNNSDVQVLPAAKVAGASRRKSGKVAASAAVGTTATAQRAAASTTTTTTASPFFSQHTPKSRRQRRVFQEDDDDDERDDMPLDAATAAAKTVKVPAQRPSAANDKPHKKKRVIQVDDLSSDDDDDDDDEAVALRLAIAESQMDSSDDLTLALEESQKSYAREKRSKKKRSTSSPSVLEALGGGGSSWEASEAEKEVIEIDDEDMPEDEDDNYGEKFLTKDAKEARSILKTAKRLSCEIMHTLASWGGSGGMILQDGAVAFSGNDTNESLDRKLPSDWISDDTMKQVCPEVDLAPYQLIGVNWLNLLHKKTVDVNGKKTSVNGVLADEMGLGKTCQTIAFLAYLKYCNSSEQAAQNKQNANGADDLVDSDNDSIVSVKEMQHEMPHLIVVPASVLSNWAIEFKKFAPHLNVVKYHGSMEERVEIQAYLRQFLSKKRDPHDETLDVILAPMTYFQKEKSDDRSFLRKFRYNYMVCDEAHLLKNHQGHRYKNLDKFRTNHRLLLSGTPVMNNPQELMSLLCFLMPLFSRKSHGFALDEESNDGGARMLQHFVKLDRSGDDDVAAYRKLKELFAPFVLRRRKQEVLAQVMPPKSRKVEFVDLDPAGRQVYDAVLQKHVENKDSRAREHLFTQLRKAAHHPLLLRTRYLAGAEKDHLVDCFMRFGAFRGDGIKRERVEEELERFNDFDIHITALELMQQNRRREGELRRYILDEADLFSSAKCQRLRTLLPDLVGKGHRVLIFSVWTSCLDLLSCLLELLGMKYLRMEGSTAVSDRQSLIDEFNRDESIPVFLLSTKACGLGINLTAADVCIMHDIDFNPFNDLQAEDRCHRIGQKRPVQVIKLVSKDTVDELIYSMQERKAKMSAAIMESSSFQAKKERDEVLKNAMDQFLASPSGRKETTADLSYAIEVDRL